MIPCPELVPLAVLAASGAVMGLVAFGSVLGERRARARRLGEVRHLDEMLRLDDEAHSTVLRDQYATRLGEAICGFTVHDYARDPKVKTKLDAYLRRLGEGSRRQER